MKKSELKQIIKEEIQNVILESWKWTDIDPNNKAKLIYYGTVLIQPTPTDYFITAKDKKLWKFIYGYKNTTKVPYVKFIKKLNSKVSIPKGRDFYVTINNKKWVDIPDKVALYQLPNKKIVWEY